MAESWSKVKSLEFTCQLDGCQDKMIAYVKPNSGKNTIHLCQGFWTHPRAAIIAYTQIGTLFHELSHLLEHTLDRQYGLMQTIQLSESLQYENVKTNADNYEFFSQTFIMVAAYQGLLSFDRKEIINDVTMEFPVPNPLEDIMKKMPGNYIMPVNFPPLLSASSSPPKRMNVAAGIPSAVKRKRFKRSNHYRNR